MDARDTTASIRSSQAALAAARRVSRDTGKSIGRVVEDALLAHARAPVASRLTTPEPNGRDAWTAIRESEVRRRPGTTGRMFDLFGAFSRYEVIREFLAADVLAEADAKAAADEELQRALGRLGVDP